MTAPGLTIVGRVRKAHGIRGELVIEPFTDAPDAVFASGRRLFAGTVEGDPSPGAPELHVTGARPFKEGWLVTFAEVTSRTDAERWRQRYVLMPADELDPPNEGEVYLHELVGLGVQLESGEPVGEVIATYELPQGILLEVQRPEKGTVLVPFRSEVVREVDREQRVMTIDPPEGLLD
jgi:16S rRNA processing protein RimM